MKLNTEIVTDYLNDICDKQTKEKIEKWIDESPEHQSYFQELKFYWECKNSYQIDFDTKKGFQQLLIKRKTEQKKYFLKLFQYASIIIILVALGITSFYQFSPNSKQVIVDNESSFEKQIMLPDGSKIILYKGSSVRYFKNTNRKNRIVQLSGSAFFNVSKNKTKPFIIETTNSITRVIGTSFKISERKSDTKINVRSGIVEFMEKENTDNKVRLTKNESAKLIYHQKVIIKNNIKNKPKHFIIKQLIYENEKLDKICKDLSEIFNHEIKIEGESIKQQTLSATFENQDLQSILESIAFTLNLTLENKTNYIQLK